MKILHVTPWYYPATYWGGPIFSVSQMNNALAEIPGVEAKVLTTDAAGPKVSDALSAAEKQTEFAYEVNSTKRIAGLSISPGLLTALPAVVGWADVVHLSYAYSFPTLPTLMLCQLYKRPVVWSLRGALLDDRNRHEYNAQGRAKYWLKAIWNRTCRGLIPPQRTALHVTSAQEREAVANVYPDARLAVIPNGVEVPDALPVRDQRPSDEKLRLMFMGRLAPKKGVENLLRAVAKLDMPVSLDVYGTGTGDQGGPGYSEDLVALARELGLLEKKVRFRGQVKGEAKTRAFMDADVCVIPSYSESFCIVVAEALAMGLPVIVSDRLAWGEVAKRGSGLMVGNEPDSLAEAMQKISAMDLGGMGERGWRWMRESFTWDLIAKQMFELYQDIIENRKSGAVL